MQPAPLPFTKHEPVHLARSLLPASLIDRARAELLTNTPWFIVKYSGGRYNKGAVKTTPCYTSFYNSFIHDPVPDWIKECASIAEQRLALKPGYFNAFILRFYVDGDDRIDWHSDARAFLRDPAQPMIVGSFSFGTGRRFEMRPVENPWATNGCVFTGPLRSTVLEEGDFFAMMGAESQDKWVHRVPTDGACATWRANLNMRHIAPGMVQAGLESYYMYTVTGDDPVKLDRVFDPESSTATIADTYGFAYGQFVTGNAAVALNVEKRAREEEQTKKAMLVDRVTRAKVADEVQKIKQAKMMSRFFAGRRDGVLDLKNPRKIEK